MTGRLFSSVGILGVIVTFIVAVTTFSSKDLLCIPFVVIGVLLSIIIIIALGEFLHLYEKNQSSREDKNEQFKN